MKLFEDNKEAIAHTGNVIESTQFMTFKNNLSDATKYTKAPGFAHPIACQLTLFSSFYLAQFLGSRSLISAQMSFSKLSSSPSLSKSVPYHRWRHSYS